MNFMGQLDAELRVVVEAFGPDSSDQTLPLDVFGSETLKALTIRLDAARQYHGDHFEESFLVTSWSRALRLF